MYMTPWKVMFLCVHALTCVDHIHWTFYWAQSCLCTGLPGPCGPSKVSLYENMEK